MKIPCLLLLLVGSGATMVAQTSAPGYPVTRTTNSPIEAVVAVAPSLKSSPAALIPSSATPVAPPAGAAKRSAADLELLLAPIALYPDPLIATILPASAYPLEIVQAARFVANTNNLAKLDAQPWDANVKAVARFPTVIQKMSDELQWTMELGEVFLAQQLEVMESIQSLRAKAQTAGKLKTTPEQVVVVTNAVVERTFEQQVVYVTNTVIQVQPASAGVVYVPSYNPSVVYLDDDDDAAAVVSFGIGITFGAIMANNCDWGYGGCYHGYYPPYPPPYPPPYRPPPGVPPGTPPPGGGRPPGTPPSGNRPGDRPPTASTLPARQPGQPAASTSQRWQPDQSRLNKAGATSPTTQEARGWGSSSGISGNRPVTGTTPSYNRPATTPASSFGSGGPGAGASRPSPSVSPSRSDSFSRSAASKSAFGGTSSGAGAWDFSNRGTSSRSSGGFSGGRSGGGGSRGGGGRR